MRLALALAAVLTVAACVQPVTLTPVMLSAKDQTIIKGAMTYNLIDPSSAQFRNIRAADVELTDGRTVRRVCGEINGKNQFGGYVGFEMFSGWMIDGKFQNNGFSGPCE
jgi:hypothetical protein